MPETLAYSPGPWRIGKRDSVVSADGFEVCDPDQGPHLAESFDARRKHWGSTPGSHIERSEDEILANARLIAAAPQMFEAIKEHLEKSGPREWSPGEENCKEHQWHKKFLAIIRKVEEEA